MKRVDGPGAGAGYSTTKRRASATISLPLPLVGWVLPEGGAVSATAGSATALTFIRIPVCNRILSLTTKTASAFCAAIATRAAAHCVSHYQLRNWPG